jgi:hypothetical protein
MLNEWELHAAWDAFNPSDIEQGFAEYLQRQTGWRDRYTRRSIPNWTVIDLLLPREIDVKSLNDILDTLASTAKLNWRWSWPNQLPTTLLLPIHLKHKSHAMLFKLKHG